MKSAPGSGRRSSSIWSVPGRGWERPSNWYLTGFLVPRRAPAEQRGDADADDDFEAEVKEKAGLGDDSSEDRRPAKKGFFPSSMGLSFLVSESVEALEVTVRWGDYHLVQEGAGTQNGHGSAGDQVDGAGAKTRAGGVRSWWQRTPREETVRMVLPATDDPSTRSVPDSGGLALHSVARPVDTASFAGWIAPGTRSVSVFLVNERTAKADRGRDEAFAFQVEIEVRSETPFVARPDPRVVSGDDWDELVADLQYAGVPEYAGSRSGPAGRGRRPRPRPLRLSGLHRMPHLGKLFPGRRRVEADRRRLGPLPGGPRPPPSWEPYAFAAPG